MSHSAVVDRRPALRLARKGIPAQSAAAVIRRTGAGRRTRASGLTVAVTVREANALRAQRGHAIEANSTCKTVGSPNAGGSTVGPATTTWPCRLTAMRNRYADSRPKRLTCIGWSIGDGLAVPVEQPDLGCAVDRAGVRARVSVFLDARRVIQEMTPVR